MGSASKPGDAPGNPGDIPEQDDVKRRFKEALDRKNGRHLDGPATGEGGEHAKVHGGAHGPAHQQRQFRRKSG
jgi:hypothetical protein